MDSGYGGISGAGEIQANRRKLPWVLLATMLFSMSVCAGELPQEPGESVDGIVHSAPISPVVSDSPIPAFVPALGNAGAQTPAATARCSLDVVSGQPAPMAMVIDHRVPLTLVGWAADIRQGVPSAIAFLLVGTDKAYGTQGKTGLPRPDVAHAMQKPEFAFSGYSITASLAAIPQGEYHAVLSERFGRTNRLCSLNHTIAVK